jgi:hypothetical protein
LGQSTDQIENHIRSTRRELGSNLQELEHKVRDATDWRVQFERHPAALLGAAFAGGILLSAGLGGRSRGRAYDGEAAANTDGRRTSQQERGGADPRSTAPGVWDNIKDALIGAAGTQLRTVLGEIVPGFREHDPSAKRPFAASASVAHNAPGGSERMPARSRGQDQTGAEKEWVE